jgi:hypothetical protein
MQQALCQQKSKEVFGKIFVENSSAVVFRPNDSGEIHNCWHDGKDENLDVEKPINKVSLTTRNRKDESRLS